jgi:subtilisin family serine protease
MGSGWHLIGWTSAQSVSSVLGNLRSISGIDQVDASHVYRVNRTPNDSFVTSQYALSQVDAFGAWEYEVGTSSRVTIAIVDSGIDSTQPDLTSKLTNTQSYIFDQGTGAASLNNPPTPACNHATRVAGVAAATSDNASQVAGMSWGAQLVSFKIFRDVDCNSDCSDASFSGCVANDPAIIGAINRAVAIQNTSSYGRVVVNMSLGGTGGCAGAVQSAITTAVNAGVVIIAATGNDGSAVNTPGNCSGVIPMGATDNTNNVASFSSRGAELAAGGMVAPGVGLLTTDLNGNTANATGTSFAAPMGAGLAALMLSARPTLTQSQVQTYMRAGAENIGQSSTVQGAGRMNAYRSMRLAVKGTLAGFDGEQKPIAFPNPFRVSQSPTVSFSLPTSLQGSSTVIKIYTQDGVFLRELTSLAWDGKNADGNLVASGTYVFVVSSSRGTARGRLAVIR